MTEDKEKMIKQAFDKAFNKSFGEEIYNKFLVIKQEWIKENLDDREINLLHYLIKKAATGKPMHSYYVVNTDEPYAEKVKELILNGEQEKQQIKEISE